MDRDEEVLQRFESESKRRETTAARLVRIAGRATLFHDERNEGYAAIVDKGIRKILRIRGKDFRQWLQFKYWKEYESASNAEGLQSALGICEAQAIHEGCQIALSNRLAFRDGRIYIDLADDKWRTACVSKDGWEVSGNHPIVFRRYRHQCALPEPLRGGRLDSLDELIHIKTSDDRLLVRAWLVTAPLEDIPRPALTLFGAQGGGKTTTARMLSYLMDPSISDNLSLPRDPCDLAQVLDHHAIPNFDNTKHVSSQCADMLCRAVTGGGFSKRELYSDAEDVFFVFKRPMILNGINIPTQAPDLLDRLMLIEVDRVPDSQKQLEADLWKKFNAQSGLLLGALLDEMVIMLRTPFATAQLPRMADFALWAARWAEGTGIGGKAFLDAYYRNISRQTEEALETDCVGCAVRDLVNVHEKWSGTPGELLKALNDQRNGGPTPADWPKRENSLSKRLRVLHTTLDQSGIKVGFSKSGQRMVTLEKKGNEPPQPPKLPNAASATPCEVDGAPATTARAGQDSRADRPAVRELSNGDPNTDAALGGSDSRDNICGALSGNQDEETEVEI